MLISYKPHQNTFDLIWFDKAKRATNRKLCTELVYALLYIKETGKAAYNILSDEINQKMFVGSDV